MQGIRTKKHGDNCIHASCDSKTIIVPRDPALNLQGQYQAAAKQLAELLGWCGWWYCAKVPKVAGLVWVCAQDVAPNTNFYVPRVNPNKEVPR